MRILRSIIIGLAIYALAIIILKAAGVTLSYAITISFGLLAGVLGAWIDEML